MERNLISLESKDIIDKKEAVEGCKESDGFKAFNNQQECQIQSAQSQQLHRDTKQAVPMIINSPFFRPFFSGAPVNSQLFKGVPVASDSVIPWCGTKIASAPDQLTIFYGGMMKVYDGISPEKAQAIMFLAGNLATGDAPQQRAQPCSDVSSPMSVSSHAVDQLFGGPANTNRVMSSLGQAMQSAIPQARKASLARFFEKRKERVMASAPYSLSKNTEDSAANSNAVVIASK